MKPSIVLCHTIWCCSYSGTAQVLIANKSPCILLATVVAYCLNFSLLYSIFCGDHMDIQCCVCVFKRSVCKWTYWVVISVGPSSKANHFYLYAVVKHAHICITILQIAIFLQQAMMMQIVIHVTAKWWDDEERLEMILLDLCAHHISASVGHKNMPLRPAHTTHVITIVAGCSQRWSPEKVVGCCSVKFGLS